MEWLAEVLLTMIVLTLVLPALVLAMLGWWFDLAAWLAVLVAALAGLADAIVWIEILKEFAHKTVH
jgi:hypothetical protein